MTSLMTSRRNRTHRMLSPAVLVLLAALAAAGVFLLARVISDSPAQTAGTAQTAVSAGTTASAGSSGSSGSSSSAIGRTSPSAPTPTSAPDPAIDGVVLPKGSDTEDGYPTRFGRSDLGAVAAQVALAQAQIGFDYDQAAQVARIYTAPEDASALVQRSRAAVLQRRRQAGVPATSAVPAPATYAMTPLAFTVTDFDNRLDNRLDNGLKRDCVVVNLLSYVTLTTTDGASRDSLYAGTQLYAWVDGDWKVVEASEADLARLAAQGQPQAAAQGTPEFVQAGWIRIGGEYQ